MAFAEFFMIENMKQVLAILCNVNKLNFATSKFNSVFAIWRPTANRSVSALNASNKFIKSYIRQDCSTSMGFTLSNAKCQSRVILHGDKETVQIKRIFSMK